VFNVQTLACGPMGCTASFEKELEQQGAPCSQRKPLG
jgi:hypothetical protein